MAGYAIGGAFLSRLNAVLREDKGYTYGVRMNFSPLHRGGSFAVQGSFRTEVLVDAVNLTRELIDVAAAPITPAEVSEAVAFFTGVSPLRYATAEGVADQAANQALMGLPDDYVDRSLALLRSVTPDSATAAYASLVRPDDLSLVVVGDAEHLAEPLRAAGFADLEVVNSRLTQSAPDCAHGANAIGSRELSRLVRALSDAPKSNRQRLETSRGPGARTSGRAGAVGYGRDMQCPVDQTVLQMTDRQGVEIDYCPTCRGVWLDRGELDKIIERSDAQAPAGLPRRRPPAPPDPRTESVGYPQQGHPQRGYAQPGRPQATRSTRSIRSRLTPRTIAAQGHDPRYGRKRKKIASVASCFTLALVHSAAKRAITLTSVRVEAVGSYAGPRFDAVRISVDVGGPTPGELADLIVAAERVCYVSNTLRAGADITVAAE